MSPRRKEKTATTSDLLGLLAEGIKTQAKRPNIHAYVPHTKQEDFHCSAKPIRLYIGGNRSGKTTGGLAEDIWWMRGQHPHQPVPEAPTYGRIISVDLMQGVNQVIIPQLKRWMPPSLLINGSWEDSYDKQNRVLTCSNGSTVELMSYEQDVEKFAGTARHWTHYDEEPPEAIYKECQARLIDYGGHSWLTLTPLNGMTWIFDDLFLAGQNGDNPLVHVTVVSMDDNPHINAEAKAQYLSTLDPEERRAREHGQFVQLGGLVYKHFSKNVHVVPFEIPPKTWEWYTSMDHGFNNPTAWLWHAVAPDGSQIITFAEHYEREMTVQQHAARVHEIEAGFKKVPDIRIADPATAQRQGVTGTSVQTEYAIAGLPIMPGNNDVHIGVTQVANYMRINEATGKPFWVVTDNCVNLIRELERLRWKTWSSKKAEYQNNPYEQIHKKDDHAADALRYFLTFMPDLKPVLEAQLAKKSAPPNSVVETFDHTLITPKTPWEVFSGTETFALEGGGL